MGFVYCYGLVGYHLNSLNYDNQQFLVSLPCNVLRNVFRNKKSGITYMPFRMPSEDLHIATKFDPVLSRLSESRWYVRGRIILFVTIVWLWSYGSIIRSLEARCSWLCLARESVQQTFNIASFFLANRYVSVFYLFRHLTSKRADLVRLRV